MSGINVMTFNVAGNQDIPLDVATNSDSIKITRSYEWSLVWILTGLVGGPPDLVLEGSHNETDWFNIASDSAGAAIIIDLGLDVPPVIDAILPYQYIRVRTITNGATAGTVKAVITLVQDA